MQVFSCLYTGLKEPKKMDRRSLIKSLTGMAVLLFALPSVTRASASRRPSDNHQCDDYCFDAAEVIARANIAETGDWKLRLYDWRKRSMIVTRCGVAACEVSRASTPREPHWEYRRRSLTSDEQSSFRAEYGRSHWLLLGFSANNIRGFILNGRHDGWSISTGPTA